MNLKVCEQREKRVVGFSPNSENWQTTNIYQSVGALVGSAETIVKILTEQNLLKEDSVIVLSTPSPNWNLVMPPPETESTQRDGSEWFLMASPGTVVPSAKFGMPPDYSPGPPPQYMSGTPPPPGQQPPGPNWPSPEAPL